MGDRGGIVRGLTLRCRILAGWVWYRSFVPRAQGRESVSDAPSSISTDRSQLSRQAWLLLSLSGAAQPLDRVRLQKALFLFSRRTKVPEGQQYTFEPYLYGPFSFQLYPDLEKLVEGGLVRPERLGYTTSPGYTLTGAGEREAARIEVLAPKPRLEALRGIRDWVAAQSFTDLLATVYRLYPEFGVNSVFRTV
jgi:hypothetical protein